MSKASDEYKKALSAVSALEDQASQARVDMANAEAVLLNSGASSAELDKAAQAYETARASLHKANATIIEAQAERNRTRNALLASKAGK